MIEEMSKYGHRDTNFKVEDKLTPIGIEMLYDVFPGICVHQIPSYKHGEGTQCQRSLQAKGVDVIIYKQNYIVSTVDFKCYNRDKFTAIVIELEKAYTYRNGITEADFGKPISVDPCDIYNKVNGWNVPKTIHRPDNTLITSREQLIIQQGYEETFIFSKAKLQTVMSMYANRFNTYSDGKVIPWTISKSTTDEDLAEGKIMITRNKILDLERDRDIVKRLINRKCQLLGDSWQIVEL